MSIKLVHGLKDGKIVKVTEVANGLACDCICRDCNAPLVAVNKDGNKPRPYFEHYSRINSKEIATCKASQETAIHYLAKEIIEKNKSITLPPYCVSVDKYNGEGRRKYTIKDLQFFEFDYVINENNISTSQGFRDIKPDLIACKGPRRLFIEIAVSHFADIQKIDGLKKHNISTIEIDLSKFDRTGTEKDLEKHLQGQPVIKWLYHVKHKEYWQKALKMEQELAENEERKRKASDIKQKERHKERLQEQFYYGLYNIILKGPYRGNLFIRIEQFIQSQYSELISIYRNKSGLLCIEHEIEGLEDIYINENDNSYEIDCEFMGLSLKVSIQSQQCFGEKLGCFFIAKIYHQASKQVTML